jgi:hypothetical protein
MEINYTLWTNVSSGHRRPYRSGDILVAGHRGTIDAADIASACEPLFSRHNSSNRPDGQIAPSMSTGDVIEFEQGAFSVDRIGFEAVTINDADRITDRTWRDIMREQR